MMAAGSPVWPHPELGPHALCPCRSLLVVLPWPIGHPGLWHSGLCPVRDVLTAASPGEGEEGTGQGGQAAALGLGTGGL
jgi:hypothetical protein